MSVARPSAAAPARTAIALAGVATAAGAAVLATGSTPSTTYGGTSTILLALMLLAGLGLVAAGVITSLAQGARRIPELALLAGFAWFAPVWVAWQDGPPLVRSVATVLAGFTFALVLHLVLASPGGRVGRGAARTLVGAAYAEALAAALLLALFRDPYLDPSCWANCTANSFLVRSYPSLAHAVVTADRWFVAGAAVALVAICVARLARGSRLARFRLAATAGPGIVFAVGVVVRSVVLQRTSIEDPFDPGLRAAFVLQSVALVLLAAGLIAGVVRAYRERRAVARMVANLDEAPAPGSVQAALAEALGDPELRVAYHLGDGRHVDAVGHEVEAPEPVPGKALTDLNRNGYTIAVIAHAGAAELERPIGPALLLALENERLQADVLAKLEELQASRARVVETADAERRRLERDLHDGAQQRLLALSYDIRLARAGAEAEGEADAERELTRALEQTQAVLEELRGLAHGIYPAILAEAGLGPALATLADGAPLPVEILGAVPRRYPAPVETTAYFTVAEAVDDAARRGADHAVVSVLEEDGRLLVSVEDSGSDRTSTLVGLADRVGALGGNLVVEPTPRPGRDPVPIVAREMSGLPTGVVTFLFTDMEDSTRLAQTLHDDWPGVMSQHRRLLRATFGTHGGHEVDIQGDSSFFSFASPDEAVRAAVDGQRALAEHSWPGGVAIRVRTGIHTAHAEPKDGQYFGLGVHRAARIMAAGRGGQILLSASTYALLADDPPADVDFRDLGEQHLKGLDRPERLYEAVPGESGGRSEGTLRVVVADDTMLMREGIVRLLREAGMDVVAEVGDADQLLTAVRRLTPDAVIVDIRMPPTYTDEGLVAAQRIRAEHPEVGVLVLSQHVEPSYALRLLEEYPERVGYLLKERVFDVAILVDALRRLGDGETVIDPTIVSRLVGRRRREDPLAELTEREREVLALVAEGLSNKALAQRLFVTERTVEAHVKQIFLKLGLGTNPASHRRVLAVLAYLRAT